MREKPLSETSLSINAYTFVKRTTCLLLLYFNILPTHQRTNDVWRFDSSKVICTSLPICIVESANTSPV